jgi:CheY-like chemotaxis protein
VILHAEAVSPALPYLLLADGESQISQVLAGLRERFRVATAGSAREALQQIERRRPAFVIADLEMPDERRASVCRAAKQLELPATVLVTASVPELVPEALAAGCDGVLLKPFPPNLLYSRFGRLVRERSRLLRERALRQRAKAHHLIERGEAQKGGTNQLWPNARCPSCNHQGVTSFEFVSYRRAWYACLACHSVWIAARLESR